MEEETCVFLAVHNELIAEISLWFCNFQTNMTLHDTFSIKNSYGAKFLFVRPSCFEFQPESHDNMLYINTVTASL